MDTDTLQKIFELMEKYKIENFKEGDLEITRQSNKLDEREKSHNLQLKELVASTARNKG